ncbi:hypothetical protein KHA90_15965 [Flavobacterium psychroterrae]|uniref:Lipoprotein n=1 Tax=Flavobacterium psychroterrae TaxID=2133767 RepID=A0ABS5PDZ8_9FLAO|nr:hypothetical protein [Flavobacterium psychroterrae]MBS7232515.1 hypothetical protein [Flavobacterium psychroterrae]
MKKIYLTILLIFFYSCGDVLKPNCDESANSNRETECLIIFDKLPAFSTPYLNAKGKNLLTGKECECEDIGRWWIQYKEYLKKGDTIIKKKGELIFSIHKKDTVLRFNYECNDKVYK